MPPSDEGPARSWTDDTWVTYLRELRQQAHPQGTLGYADAAARRRAAASVRSGECVSLSRQLRTSGGADPAFRLTATYEPRDRLTVGFDRLAVRQHGVDHTHLDAWSHYGLDGTFFPGVPTGEPNAASVAPWAESGVIARAVLLDLPSVRGAAWVEADRPVSMREMDAALAAAGGDLLPGDAVLVYLGRDRFEAAGHRYRTVPESLAAGEPRAGLGAGAAEWLARRRPSLVCWDFLDAVHRDEPRSPVHLLIWAIGLGLVDNCDLGPAWRAMGRAGRKDGLLTVAPLRMWGATASLVNPLLVL